jgi:hypothetical protein
MEDPIDMGRKFSLRNMTSPPDGFEVRWGAVATLFALLFTVSLPLGYYARSLEPHRAPPVLWALVVATVFSFGTFGIAQRGGSKFANFCRGALMRPTRG